MVYEEEKNRIPETLTVSTCADNSINEKHRHFGHNQRLIDRDRDFSQKHGHVSYMIDQA